MKSLSKKFAIFLLSLFLLLPTIQPKAEIMGGKWTTDIKVYLDLGGYSDISSAMTTAISSWNSRLGSIGSNIRIRNLSSSEASQANVTVRVRDYIGAVALTTNYPSKTASVYTGALIEVNSKQFEYLNSIEKMYAASHELGHVLGLAHTTTSRESVMKDGIQSGIALPSVFDQEELDRIY